MNPVEARSGSAAGALATTHVSSGGASRARTPHVLAGCGVLALAAIAYSGALRGTFVFDDLPEIASNDLLGDPRNFLASTVGWAGHPTRFVGYLSFALNRWLGGLDPFGYHLANVAIHVCTALLVYALAVVTFRTARLRGSALAGDASPIGFAAAALFMAHPLQTQAVTYVVQRFASLAALFYLLALVLHARWRAAPPAAGRAARARRAFGYAPVLVAGVFAMLTKEIAFTLPVAIVLWDACFGAGTWRSRLPWLAPVLALLAVIPALLVGVNHPAGQLLGEAGHVASVQTDVSRLEYLRTQVAVVATYLRLLAIPAGQRLEWEFPIARAWNDPRVIAGAAVLGAIAAVAVFTMARTSRRAARPLDAAARLAGFGIAFFFLALAVESSVIPIVDVIFEHRAYLPSAGIFVTAAAALGLAAHRALGAGRAGRAVVAAALVLALPLALGARARNEVWRDDLSLWTDAVEKSPGLARARVNLGLALVERRQLDAGIAEYLAALRLDPKNPDAHNNLGVALYQKGLLDEAISHFLIAIALRPETGEPHENLGIAYGRKGWTDKAAEEIGISMQLRARRR